MRLMRLAWSLSQLGVAPTVQRPRSDKPFISILRARRALQGRASPRGHGWVFTWGRGQWVAAYDEDAVTRACKEAW